MIFVEEYQEAFPGQHLFIQGPLKIQCFLPWSSPPFFSSPLEKKDLVEIKTEQMSIILALVQYYDYV